MQAADVHSKISKPPFAGTRRASARKIGAIAAFRPFWNSF